LLAQLCALQLRRSAASGLRANARICHCWTESVGARRLLSLDLRVLHLRKLRLSQDRLARVLSLRQRLLRVARLGRRKLHLRLRHEPVLIQNID
jgi:hypothetical protein